MKNNLIFLKNCNLRILRQTMEKIVKTHKKIHVENTWTIDYLILLLREARSIGSASFPVNRIIGVPAVCGRQS